MADTVIVALPAEDEKVNKISSEKRAHLTVLYLGDAQLSADAVLYVQHAAAELSPVYMSVDYRGTLGEDEADVIFFEKNSWEDSSRIRQFRHYLLLNDEIRRAYDSAQQFPEWNPHLTLGYPEAPANVDPEDDPPRFFGIHFDRIAVWMEDSDGPEFRLKYSDHGMEMAMSSTERGAAAAENVLAHYGVKGMKWGVVNKVRANQAHVLREKSAMNERIATGTASKTDKFNQVMVGKGLLGLHPNVAAKLAVKYSNKADKKEAKLESSLVTKEWKKDASSAEMATKVFQKAAKDFEKTAEIINNDANYKGVDLAANPKVRRSYDATMNHYFNQHLAQASVDLTLDDRGHAYIYQMDRTGQYMRGTEHRAVLDHADAKPFPDYKIEFNELGHAVGFEVEIDSIEHGFLAHYGVKGMKWGVTTKDGATSVTKSSEKKSHLVRGAKDVTVSQRKAGAYVTTKGGQRQKASTDAVKAHATRQVAKKSTTDALSTKQLKDSIERMRLEQEFAKLNKKTERINRGRKFVNALMGGPPLLVAPETRK